MSALDLIHTDMLTAEGVVHAFTTRAGGVSGGPYGSLNITRSRGDDAENVERNRERLRQALALDYLVFATQVHGRTVLRVDDPPRGALPAGEGDALMTNRPGIGLVCQTADCTPILMFDPLNRAIAAVHSGWRSTVQNIVLETVVAMRSAYGTEAGDLLVAIGPSISQDNYRVGPEVVAEFSGVFEDLTGIVSDLDGQGGAQLDVAAACRRQLTDAGIPGEQIYRSPICTYAEETRLFSARRSHHRGESGIFGGQGGVIGLKA